MRSSYAMEMNHMILVGSGIGRVGEQQEVISYLLQSPWVSRGDYWPCGVSREGNASSLQPTYLSGICLAPPNRQCVYPWV